MLDVRNKRLTIRSVDHHAQLRLRELHVQTRLPMALLAEDAIDMLWESYMDAGHDLEEPESIES